MKNLGTLDKSPKFLEKVLLMSSTLIILLALHNLILAVYLNRIKTFEVHFPHFCHQIYLIMYF